MKIGFLFSGQGAQYPGMMKDLFETEPSAKEVFRCADQALGRPISEICFNGTQEELNLTHNTQPCMLAADLTAAKVLESYGVKAAAAAGFSLGEYAALCYAGCIPMEEVFSLIQLRADAMQEAVRPGEGAMAAFIGAASSEVEEICRKVSSGYVTAANYNSPVQTVISGTASGVDEACRMGQEQGLRCQMLAVSAPFHCALMKPAAERLSRKLEAMTFGEPSIPVYMNVNGEILSGAKDAAGLLYRQAMSPVYWTRTLENMAEDGIDTFIECGAGKTLSGLAKKTLKQVRILRVENEKTLRKTLEELQVSC